MRGSSLIVIVFDLSLYGLYFHILAKTVRSPRLKLMLVLVPDSFFHSAASSLTG